jgi:hypothetical protein
VSAPEATRTPPPPTKKHIASGGRGSVTGLCNVEVRRSLIVGVRFEVICRDVNWGLATCRPTRIRPRGLRPVNTKAVFDL